MSNVLRPLARTGALLAMLAVTAGSAMPAQTASPLSSLTPPVQANRVPSNPNFGPQTQLANQLPAWVSEGSQISTPTVDLSAPLRVSLVLRRAPAVQAAFEQFLAAQQNPSSSFFHQWLTPQQVGNLFGPTASDLAAITSWLAAQGLTLDSVSPSQVIIDVHGSTAAVGNAFRTSFGYFNFNGIPRLSAVSEPSIPTALAAVIDSVHGLTQVPVQPMSRLSGPHVRPGQGAATASPLLTTGPTNGVYTHYLTPNDFATIYDISSVYAAGNTGATVASKAQHIAIIGQSRVAATDISEFAANVGITSYNLNTIIPPTGADPGPVCTFANANTCATGGDQGEQTLDVDRVIGTAPGAQVDLVVSAATTAGGGIDTAAQYNVNTLLDPVMTISYGGCELQSGGSGAVTYWNDIFSAGAAEGISSFASSGDSGANACAASFTPTTTAATASINFICASQYVTCVGGTEFNDATGNYWSTTNGVGGESALSYIPEGGWNEPTICNTGSFCPSGSGGGPSAYVTKPTWQTGTGVPADGHRDTPDIAFSAASHDGFYACLDFQLGSYTSQGVTSADNCTDAGGGYFFSFSGTSVAAPGMAGVAGLLNTKIGTAQGNLNPLLYKLAASSPTTFHDVTVATSGVSGCALTTPSMCNNSTPGASANSTTVAGGLQGYLVGTGYDEVTGLGSIDVANFLTAAASASTTSPTFTLTPASASLSLVSGATTGNTDTITLTSTNGFAGTVDLSCSISASSAADQPTCAMTPTSTTLASGGTATATATISSTTAHTAVKAAPVQASLGWRAGGGAMLAMLLCLLPVRRRRAFRTLAVFGLLALGIGVMSGCGGSGSAAAPSVTQSSAGAYTVTVTATGDATGSTTATTAITTFALTIN